MVDNVEHQIYELIRPYAGTYIFNIRKVELNRDTDLNSDLSIDELEAEDLMNDFFNKFNVDKGKFNIQTYFPDIPFSLNPFRKTEPVPVPAFTINMLIESAKAGKWLFD